MTDIQKTDQIVAWADRIFRRADGVDEVVPTDHQPNWQDRPSRSRLYPGVPHIALPSPSELRRTYEQIAEQSAGEPLTFAGLSVLLYLLAGPLSRKLDVNWNTDPPPVNYNQQEYRRGTASGGGLYPVQIYVIASGPAPPGAGVYHYCSARHALVPIHHGEWAQAFAEASCMKSSQYSLVISIDFWASCFKYHNFGYHVSTEDVGATLGALRLACDALKIKHQATLSFHDQAVNAVIGADGSSESAFAVVSLGNTVSPNGGNKVMERAPVTPTSWQRSKAVHVPEELLAVHRSTLLDQPPTTILSPERQAPHSEEQLDAVLRRALPSILVSRRSAWGSMHGPAPMAGDDIRALLRFVSRRAGAATTAVREQIPAGSLEFALRIRNVNGTAPGLYRWDRTRELIDPLTACDVEEWQSTYSMNNYNIDESAVILFVLGHLKSVTEIHGARGYRILNAYAGIAAQLIYTAAAALHLDCGVVLGVRAQRVKQRLQLPPEQNVMLAVYLSRAQKRAELFSFHLLPDVPTWKPA